MRRSWMRAASPALLALAATLAVAPPSIAGPSLSYTTINSSFASTDGYTSVLQPTGFLTGASVTFTPTTLLPIFAAPTPVDALMGTFTVLVGSTFTNATADDTFTLQVDQTRPLPGGTGTDSADLSGNISFKNVFNGNSDSSSVVDLTFENGTFQIGGLVYTLGTGSSLATFTPLANNTLELNIPGAFSTASINLYAEVVATPEPSTIASAASGVLVLAGAWWRRRRARIAA